MYQQRKKQRKLFINLSKLTLPQKPTEKQDKNTIQQPIQIHSTPIPTKNQIRHTNKDLKLANNSSKLTMLNQATINLIQIQQPVLFQLLPKMIYKDRSKLNLLPKTATPVIANNFPKVTRVTNPTTILPLFKS